MMLYVRNSMGGSIPSCRTVCFLDWHELFLFLPATLLQDTRILYRDRHACGCVITIPAGKLEYYFKFFDGDGDGRLMKKDLPVLFKKIVEYTEWESKSPAATELYEVHDTFFEVLFEKTDGSTDRIELDDWMSLWEHLLPGCMGMHNFPVWLRLLPRSLFRVMDTNDDGLLAVDEIKHFYESFVNIPHKQADALSVQAYNEMTDYGRYPLNLEGYEQIFANFLLGRTKYGPGRFIFGCFEHTAEEQSTLISGPPKEDAVIEVTAKGQRRTGEGIMAPMRMCRKE